MRKPEIDATWPLVIKRRDEVLEVYALIATKHRRALRIDRSALINKYQPNQHFIDLARHFGVTSGAINNALSHVIRIARKLERAATIESRADGKRYVVIIPVDNRAQGSRVLNLLATHDLLGALELVPERDPVSADFPQ